jgi:hypothetical protein
MVKQEFKVETICRRHSQSGDFPVTDGEARWLVRFAGDHHRWMAASITSSGLTLPIYGPHTGTNSLKFP